jgi:uncharacterized delta-60 repeat protein
MQRNPASKAKKATLSLFSVAMLLAGGAAAVRGQSALDGFDPNANGQADVVVVQPDGKILIGGEFTTLSPNGGVPVTRAHIARLNPDGTLDTAFNPNANNPVFSIAVQADGKILVGGNFTSIGGQTRNFIARLDAITGLADSFDPNANSAVYTVAVQADGKILAGGLFTNIGGQTRNDIARLDATTGLADSFDPNANGEVLSIAVQGDGKILAGGFFTSIGGQPRNNIARLDATTGLADSFDPNAAGFVYSITVQADGKILVGGSFHGPNSIGGQPRNYIARLDATTGLADSFDPNADSYVNSIALQADGKILAGGHFSAIGGQARGSIARLDATTGLPDSFDPRANAAVYSIAVQADGKILAGGHFTTLSPNGGAQVFRNRIARLETDGRLDQTLNLSTVGSLVDVTAVQPDGKILIGGSFTTVLAVARNNIARLNTDGTLDRAFDPNANSEVFSIAVQADGKILVGGFFNGANSIGGQTRNYIARLDATTGLADSFDPNANGIVLSIAVQADGKILAAGQFNTIGGQTRVQIARLDATTGLADSFDPNPNANLVAIAVQADGKILAGGSFTSIGGQTRNHIARLDATTGLADSFNPNANAGVLSIAVQPDSKILAGGGFNSIGGQTRNFIARLDATTGLADSFNPNANNIVYSIAVQADGKILAGGLFSSIGGQLRNYIARLDATTGLADSFDPSADSTVYSIAVQADGKILAGGLFTSIGGQTRSLFARLSNDTAALQNLAVTQTTITWTRGGSSPQFTRVPFEYSTDNVNYTSLGNGTATGGNWTLTGLNFSTGQNFYIRARGYYSSGYENGSESTTQSVRNAFVAGAGNPVPVLTSLSPSSKTVGSPGFTLTVNGSNFVHGATVRWNNSARVTTFVSSVKVTAQILTSDLANAGTVPVIVTNPPPGGGASNSLTFTINNPRPTVTSISPASATAGGAAFTLTVNGSGFITSSVVNWNGSTRPTTFSSSHQLTAAISAEDIATAGTIRVTVTNPGPGGGTSAPKTFTVNNPVPAISSISPSSATAGGPAFTLTVNGSNFVSGSKVHWKTSTLTTHFVSSIQVTAAVPASDIRTAGTASVTVVNAPPGGGTSNAMTFTITP